LAPATLVVLIQVHGVADKTGDDCISYKWWHL